MNLRNDWTREEIEALYDQPFLDLVFQAQTVHRQHFQANTIQVRVKCNMKLPYQANARHLSMAQAQIHILRVAAFIRPPAPRQARLLNNL